MRKAIGLYHCRLLWQELQKLTPDKNGIVHFNLAYFKQIHDIAPDAIVPE